MTPKLLLVLCLVLLPLVVVLLRAGELFCVRLESGRLRILRGRLPQRLLDDIGDILRRRPAPDGTTLRGVIEDRRLRIKLARGELNDAERQQLANLSSLWPLPKVRNANRPR